MQIFVLLAKRVINLLSKHGFIVTHVLSLITKVLFSSLGLILLGCCVVCAKICHQGHQLSEALLSSFFCDCGAGDGKNPCKCLHISTQPSAPQ